MLRSRNSTIHSGGGGAGGGCGNNRPATPAAAAPALAARSPTCRAVRDANRQVLADYKYNLADIVMMVEGGGTNYRDLALALTQALLTCAARKSSSQVEQALTVLAAHPGDRVPAVRGDPEAAVRPGGVSPQRDGEGRRTARFAARDRGPAPAARVSGHHEPADRFWFAALSGLEDHRLSMDHPTSPQPARGPQRPDRRLPVPQPRPGRSGHRLVRRGLLRPPHSGREDPTTMAASRRPRRAVRPHRPTRSHRPTAHHQRTPPADGAGPLRGPLQPPPAAPSTPARTTTTGQTTSRAELHVDMSPTSPRRPDQQGRAHCRLTAGQTVWPTFGAPQAARPTCAYGESKARRDPGARR
ncbi:hypothetical protein B0I31_109119 [Saccharothrix carnea]|uniref:Uncharacterized protein n=1 Tax=Saccharothrix carnea TaxID=1280637 RepID=A0A2P8I4D6_SACCR|nr:hypothetical protein B0I31_109119 [Saccharothrix carnea]